MFVYRLGQRSLKLLPTEYTPERENASKILMKDSKEIGTTKIQMIPDVVGKNSLNSVQDTYISLILLHTYESLSTGL